MSMRQLLAEAFRDFNAAFGLTAAHDYNLPDEPPARAEHLEAAGAEYLATLRTLLARLGDAAADVIEPIDRIDPTPAGLAQANTVTDLDAHRR